MSYATDTKLVLQEKSGSHPATVILPIDEYHHSRVPAGKTLRYRFVASRSPDQNSMPLITKLAQGKSLQFPSASVTAMTAQGNDELEPATLAELSGVLLLDRFVVGSPERTIEQFIFGVDKLIVDGKPA